MKNCKLLNFLFLFSLLVVVSCRDEEPTPDPGVDPTPDIIEIPVEIITSSISGSIVNVADDALDDVLVQVGPNTTYTDENGEFSFRNIELNQNGALVSVVKDGFFNNSKIVFSKAGQTSYSKIMLTEKVVTSSFVSSAGGTSVTSDGAKVVIPAEGVQLEGGGAYSGNVNVYATWLDPTAEDLGLRMPGDLRATNADDEAVKLVTYGMIGVELEGDNGEALNIAEGQTATIELPVPASLLGSAPSTIALWHLDETTGYWVEDGEATLTGSTYVGEVSHFSFWNVDVPYPLVHVEGRIVDDSQTEFSGLLVEIALANGGAGFGYTDSNGQYAGYVPKEEDLTLTVYNECFQVVHTGQIGPFPDNAVIPDIQISPTAGTFLTISGALIDCDDEIETDGFVLLDFGGFSESYIDVNSDGNFNETISVCDQMEVTISGVSNDPFNQGTTTVYDISGETELDLGTLKTCW